MVGIVDGVAATSVFFRFEIDGVSVGSWSTVSGLGISIQTRTAGDSARPMYTHNYPQQSTYKNITLGRAVSKDTANVIKWINDYNRQPKPRTAALTALSADGDVIVSFHLFGVVPVNWTGPSFDVSSTRIAEEQLEIAYQSIEAATEG